MSPTDRLNELLDLAREHYHAQNDHQLAHSLGIEPSMVSRMRRGLHLPPQARVILSILNVIIPGPLQTAASDALLVS